MFCTFSCGTLAVPGSANSGPILVQQLLNQVVISPYQYNLLPLQTKKLGHLVECSFFY